MRKAQGPYVLFVAMLPPAVRAALVAAIPQDEYEALGMHLFPSWNWHQTLSGYRYASSPEVISMLREAGSRIVATAITIILRRLVSGRNDDRGNYHRRVEPLGVPNGFMQLFNAINAAIDEPFRSKSLKTPHITISYRAPSAFAPRVISPVAWNIEELLLVEGGGDPYHYKVLDRWALRPIAPNPQLELGF